MAITINDLRKYLDTPVWSSRHCFYKWLYSCSAHSSPEFTCNQCRTGQWIRISDSELINIDATLKLRKVLNETKEK
jgi:hypothetical protein